MRYYTNEQGVFSLFIFFVPRIYCQEAPTEGGGIMAEADDISMDLDDWIFADEDCGPSER